MRATVKAPCKERAPARAPALKRSAYIWSEQDKEAEVKRWAVPKLAADAVFRALGDDVLERVQGDVPKRVLKFIGGTDFADFRKEAYELEGVLCGDCINKLKEAQVKPSDARVSALAEMFERFSERAPKCANDAAEAFQKGLNEEEVKQLELEKPTEKELDILKCEFVLKMFRDVIRKVAENKEDEAAKLLEIELVLDNPHVENGADPNFGDLYTGVYDFIEEPEIVTVEVDDRDVETVRDVLQELTASAEEWVRTNVLGRDAKRVKEAVKAEVADEQRGSGGWFLGWKPFEEDGLVTNLASGVAVRQRAGDRGPVQAEVAEPE